MDLITATIHRTYDEKTSMTTEVELVTFSIFGWKLRQVKLNQRTFWVPRLNLSGRATELPEMVKFQEMCRQRHFEQQREAGSQRIYWHDQIIWDTRPVTKRKTSWWSRLMRFAR